MNKAELITAVVTTTGYQKKDVEAVVSSVFGEISKGLREGKKVKIVDFGTFEVRERSARSGVNPKLLKELKEQGIGPEEAKKQAAIMINAFNAPAFKPAKALKDTVKQ